MSVITIPGGSGTVSGASGGKIYAFNNISESGLVTVAPALTSRRKITFHNPGPNDIYVAPALVQTTGSSVAFTPSNAALGGCFLVYANGGTLIIDGECQGAWQAFSKTDAGASNPLTVMDSNV